MTGHDVELGPNDDDAVQVVVGHPQDEVVVTEQVIPKYKTLRRDYKVAKVLKLTFPRS
jgi:hypothetical protein